MDWLLILFGAGFIGAAGTAGWLALARVRLAAAADSERSAREISDARVSKSEADLESLRKVAEGEMGLLRDSLRERELELVRVTEQADAERQRHLDELGKQRELHDGKLAAVEQLRRQGEERIRALNEEFEKTFRSLAAQSLKSSGEEFLKLAKEHLGAQQKEHEARAGKTKQEIETLVKPIGETLGKTKEWLVQLETQVKSSKAASDQLRDETGKLVKALGRPEVRGRYGEIQLRRVVELAGMTSWCDFTEQVSRDTDDGKLRPDMTVNLPNDRVIVVDAKTNTYEYVEAANASDEAEREARLDRFAKHVADQISKLSAKAYWSQFERSPEFVVMFVPGDQFVDAALTRRPELIEQAAEKGVILASPSTLIGLLRAVAVGWREHTLAEEAAELFQLGREFHERAATVFDYTSKLGALLKRMTTCYNQLVGSVDARLLPTIRKFEEAGAKSAKAVPELPSVEVVPRLLGAGEGGRDEETERRRDEVGSGETGR
jgi:DNA recombination protein RmuC